MQKLEFASEMYPRLRFLNVVIGDFCIWDRVAYPSQELAYASGSEIKSITLQCTWIMSTEYYKIMEGYQSDHDRNLTDPHTL